MIRRPPRSTRTDTRCPYTTLFRSLQYLLVGELAAERAARLHAPAHQVERALRLSEPAHAVIDASRSEALLRDRETAAARAEQVTGRTATPNEFDQIGRASCRERVCQYV